MAKKKATYSLKNPQTDVFVGDCREVLASLTKKVDLIFADPPFNWKVAYDGWHDNMAREEYIKFTHDWLDACIKALAPHGSIWVNIPDDTAAEIVIHLKNRGLHMINWCIWHFRFGQCTNSSFIVSKVHALYFAKDREHRTWNPDDVLEPSDRATIYADKRTRETKNPGTRLPLDVWYGKYWGRIQGNNRERRQNHQNQIPEIYLERVISACSNRDDLVLDPFLGSGTTCTVARELGRRSIGIEYAKTTAKSAFERIKDGGVRINRPDNVIIEAFFSSHQGYSSDEVIIYDELRESFLATCADKLKRKYLEPLSEFECCWALQRLRKAGDLGHVTKKRRTNDADYQKAKDAVKHFATNGTLTKLDRILCDPLKRKDFDAKGQELAPGIDPYLIRRAALGLRKTPSNKSARRKTRI